MHLGYFTDSNSNNSLLIEADVKALRELSEMFRALAAGRIKRFVIHKLPFIRVHHGVELRATCGSVDRGVCRDDEGNGHSFQWERSSSGWRDVADKLAALALAPQACHEHLGAEGDDVPLFVSKGEYGEDWWREQG